MRARRAFRVIPCTSHYTCLPLILRYGLGTWLRARNREDAALQAAKRDGVAWKT